MRRLSLLFVSLVVLAAGCKQEAKFKKAKDGLEYSVFEGSGGQKVNYGDVMQFKASGYYDDSVLATPFDTIIQLAKIDSFQLPPDLIYVFTHVNVGDSIVTRLLVDSAGKFGPLPPYAKKGKYLGFRIKIYGVIKDSATAELEKNKQIEQMRRIDSIAKLQQGSKDDEILAARIAKDGVTTVKTAKGTQVQIINPGTGMAIDSGKTVTVDYKGMSMNGKVFDQSYNESGISEKPFTFTIGQMGAIEGWDDGLRLFKNGGKGRLYIPSRLAYGSRGSGPAIQPNENLIFEIEVKNVMTPAQAMQEMKKQQAEMMKQQKAQMDSQQKK